MSFSFKRRGADLFSHFLMKTGYVIAHPSLERPILMNIPPMYTEMAHYEMTPGFDSVQQRIIRFKHSYQILTVDDKLIYWRGTIRLQLFDG